MRFYRIGRGFESYTECLCSPISPEGVVSYENLSSRGASHHRGRSTDLRCIQGMGNPLTKRSSPARGLVSGNMWL